MTRVAMVIAPGSPIDRTWVARDGHAFRFVEPPLCEMGPVQTATLQRTRVPGWKVTLPFFVDDRLTIGSPDSMSVIPRGYVMPGWVVEEQLERSLIEREVARSEI